MKSNKTQLDDNGHSFDITRLLRTLLDSSCCRAFESIVVNVSKTRQCRHMHHKITKRMNDVLHSSFCEQNGISTQSNFNMDADSGKNTLPNDVIECYCLKILHVGLYLDSLIINYKCCSMLSILNK